MKHVRIVFFTIAYLLSAPCTASGASTLSLGAISITNPIIAALGATAALSVVANRAWQAWQSKQHATALTPPDSVTLAERYYYESRRQELEQLKNELTRIKHDLLAIKARCYPTAYTFTHACLMQSSCAQQNSLHQWLAISQDKERALAAMQQHELRLLRQHDLLVREHEIIALHTALAMHSNELINQVNTNCGAYRASLDALNTTFEHFQRNSLERKAVGQLYACLIMQNYTLDRITRIVQEACIIGDYYKHLPKISNCIASSTTLIEKWQQITSCIAQNMAWINREKQLCNNRITDVEHHLAQCGGAITTLKNNLIKTVKKYLDAYDARDLSVALTKSDAATQEAKATVTLPEQEADKKDEIGKTKTVEEILADARPWTEQDFCKQFIKEGGYEQALRDFESLGLSNIKNMIGKPGKIGVLPDGRIVNVRIESKAGSPTLEIQPHEGFFNKSIKIRYGQPKY